MASRRKRRKRNKNNKSKSEIAQQKDQSIQKLSRQERRQKEREAQKKKKRPVNNNGTGSFDESLLQGDMPAQARAKLAGMTSSQRKKMKRFVAKGVKNEGIIKHGLRSMGANDVNVDGVFDNKSEKEIEEVVDKVVDQFARSTSQSS